MNQVDKATVHYSPSTNDIIQVGRGAMIYPLDHTSPYVSNSRVAFTSTVLKHNKETGEFETLNSIYKRA